jgi:hypothetical protein
MNWKTFKEGREGVEKVIELDLSKFAKAGSGPRCLTLPLIRDSDPAIKGFQGRKKDIHQMR